jgi:hypothetical protein
MHEIAAEPLALRLPKVIIEMPVGGASTLSDARQEQKILNQRKVVDLCSMCRIFS